LSGKSEMGAVIFWKRCLAQMIFPASLGMFLTILGLPLFSVNMRWMLSSSVA